jgi:hypothetical protein
LFLLDIVSLCVFFFLKEGCFKAETDM